MEQNPNQPTPARDQPLCTVPGCLVPPTRRFATWLGVSRLEFSLWCHLHAPGGAEAIRKEAEDADVPAGS